MDAPTEDAVNVYVNNDSGDDALLSTDSEYSYSFDYSEEDDHHQEDSSLSSGEYQLPPESISDKESMKESEQRNEELADEGNIQKHPQSQGGVSRAFAAVTNRDDLASDASSWEVVNSMGKRMSMKLESDTDKKRAPLNEIEAGYEIFDQDNISWSLVDDTQSIKTMTTTGTFPATSETRVDLLGVELDLQLGTFPKDDMTVSISSTIFAQGARTCPGCTLLNKPSVVFCEACGMPLTANPSLNADAELAARLAKEESAIIANNDAELARRLQIEHENSDAVASRQLQDTNENDHVGVEPNGFPLPRVQEFVNKLRGGLDDIDSPILHNLWNYVGLEFSMRSFFSCCQEFHSLQKPTDVSIGYYAFEVEDQYTTSIPVLLSSVSQSLRKRKAGRGRGIIIWDSPSYVLPTYAFGNWFALCAVLGGTKTDKYTVDSDSIVTSGERRVCLRRADQCLPLVCFSSESSSFVSPASAANAVVGKVHDWFRSFFADFFMEQNTPLDAISGPRLFVEPVSRNLVSQASSVAIKVGTVPSSPLPTKLTHVDGPDGMERIIPVTVSSWSGNEMNLTSWPCSPKSAPNVTARVMITEDLFTTMRNDGRLWNHGYHVQGFVHVLGAFETALCLGFEQVRKASVYASTKFLGDREGKVSNDNAFVSLPPERKVEITATCLSRNEYIPIALYRSSPVRGKEVESYFWPLRARAQFQRIMDRHYILIVNVWSPCSSQISHATISVCLGEAIDHRDGVDDSTIETNGSFDSKTKTIRCFLDQIPSNGEHIVLAGLRVRDKSCNLTKVPLTTTIECQLFHTLTGGMIVSVKGQHDVEVCRKVRVCHEDIRVAKEQGGCDTIPE